MLELLWISNGIHLVFKYVPLQVQTLHTLSKPCVMFTFNFMPLCLQLSFLQRCHLQYLYSLSGYLYHCWHSLYQCRHGRWCHFALITLCALIFILSCSLLTPKPKAPPSLALFFLLRTFFGDYIVAFFLFSNATYISSLVLFTLASGFCGFSFWWTNKY